MNERIENPHEVLLDVMGDDPEKVLVLSMVEDEMVVRGNMTYIESLGILELAKDQVKEMLSEED